MKILGLLLACLGSMAASAAVNLQVGRKGSQEIRLLKVRCGPDGGALRTCQFYGCSGAWIRSDNRDAFVGYLKKMGIDRAYAFGWDGSVATGRPWETILVVHSNGAVVPADEINSTADYVFCVVACSCPTAAGSPATTPAGPGPVQPNPTPAPATPACGACAASGAGSATPAPVAPTPVTPTPAPVNVRTCEDESEECGRVCKVFPKRRRREFRSRSPRHRSCLNRKLEVSTETRTFVFDTQRYRRGGDVVVMVCKRDTDSTLERYIMSKDGKCFVEDGDRDRGFTPTPIPECLKNPRELERLRRYIECKILGGCKVCLYVNECDVFVYYNEQLYRVVVRERRRRRGGDDCSTMSDCGRDRRDRHHGKKIVLKRVSRGKQREIMKHGLYGVEFERIDCR